MKIYKNRYQASKEKKGLEVIVKVEGGYIIMTVEDYKVWKNQK